MALGATLVPGGNDVMLMIGLPLLLPNFTLAYVVMNAVMFAAFVLVRVSKQAPGRERTR
jgi:toxin CptA